MLKKESVLYSFTPDNYIKISSGDTAYTLLGKNYKDNPCVVIGEEKDENQDI